MRLGVLVWPPYELFFAARDLGLVPGDALQLVDYRSPGDVARAFENGALDAVLLTADFALRLAERSPDVRAVLVVDVSAGADVILAREGLSSVADLRGRRVGVESSSLGLFLLRRALGQAGLTLDDVELVSADYPELAPSWRAGRFDAVVVYEPERSKLLAEGAVEIFDSSRIPGEIVDLLLVRQSTLEAREADLRAMVDGWIAARDLWLDEPATVAPLIGPREGLTLPQLESAMEGVELPGRDANRRLLGAGASSLVAPLERLAEEMRAMGFLRGPVDVSRLLSDRLVRPRQGVGGEEGAR